MAALLSACLELPEVDTLPPPDAGTTLPNDRDSGTPPEALTLRLVTPGEPTYTNASVELSVELSGPTPEGVELLVGGSPVATLTPPYGWNWDTSTVPEGSHTLRARATRAGATFTSEARTVIVDRTAPRLDSRVPAPLARHVTLSETMRIEASVSEPLRADTVTASSVKLYSQTGALAATPSLSADGRTLTLRPEAAIAAGTTLTVDVTSAVTDLAGNPLTPPAQAWTWEVPVFIPVGPPLSAHSGNTPAYFPSLQLDDQGRPVVAWIESDGIGYNMHVRRWTGSAWEALGGTFMATTNAQSCALQMSAGQPVVAWSRATDSTHEKVHVQRWNGSTWEALGTPLSNSTGVAYIFSVQLVTNKAGHLVVAWFEHDGTKKDLYIRRWTGTSWEPIPADTSNTTPIHFSLQIDSGGNPVVAWDSSPLNSSSTTTYLKRWNGSAWESLTAVENGSGPELLLDGVGRPILAFSGVYVLRWTGTAWTSLGETLNAFPGATPAYPSALQLDAQGRLLLVWYEYTEDGSSLLHVRRWNGTTWESLGGTLSANPAPAVAFSVSLQVDSEDLPVMAWSEQKDADRSIYVYRHNR